jgi:3-deoxy-D-manno-octulosonic-acid transferase
LGGHNILEPVWAGIPVLYGPSIANIRDSSEYVIKHGYGAKIKDAEDLYNNLVRFFNGELCFQLKNDNKDGGSVSEKAARLILDNMK